MGKIVIFYMTAAGRVPVSDFLAGKSVVVLTSGFHKKTQKTPTREIELAEEYRKDYLRRNPSHD